MKRFLFLWISFIVFLTSPLLHAVQAAAPPEQRTVRQEILILNSYHPGYAWSDDEQAGIINALREKNKNWLPVIEYLDLKRLPDGRHLAEQKKLFRRKYQNKKFPVVIAMDNPALEFAIDNQAELFGNASIVFCGINNYTPSLLKGRSEVTGIVESIDIAGTIEVMLRLHPATQEIFSPHDYTATGLAVRKELEALVPRFGPKVRFRFTDPLTMEELLKELERLPKDSLVLEVGFIADKSGRTFDISETTKRFSKHSPVPIYSTYEQRLGFGIVGGKLLSARHHGGHAASIALRVLAGEKASAIPVVVESHSQFMFDYKVMSRFGIPLSALPEGSTVINQPVSFYAAHRAVIQPALGVIVFLAVVIFLLTINIIQRRRSSEVIRRSEELFKVITSSTPDHLIVQDKDLRYSFVMNPQLGLTEQDIIGKTDYDLLSKVDADKLTEIKRQVLKTGRPAHVEVPLTSSTGGQQFFDGSYVPKFDAKGQVDGLIGYFRNVTERKRAEAEIRDKSLLNQTLLDAFPCVALLLRPTTREIIASNAAAVKVGALPGTHCFSTWGQRQDPCPWCLAPALWATGEAQHLEVKALGIVWDAHWIPVAEDLYMHFAFDITERKQMAEDLRRSEENFRRSLDDSPLGVRIITEEGETIYTNRAILDIYGFDSLDDWLTCPREKRYTPESYTEYRIRREKRKRGDYSESEYNMSIVRKDGEVRHLQVFRKEVLWDGKRQFQVIYQDITDQKRLEETLREKQAQLQAILDYSPALISIKDINGNVILANRNFAVLDAPSLHEFIGKNVFDLFPREVAENLWNNDLAALKANGPVESEEIVQHKGGSWHTYLTVKFPVYKEPGQPFGTCAISTDITKRKEVEKALRESEERYRVLFNRAVDGIFILSSNGNLVEVNESFARMHGYGTQEMLHMNLKDLDTPETAQRVPERMRRVLAGEALTFEVEHHHKDGHVFPLEVSVSLISSGGKPYVQCFHRDITERKQTELKLTQWQNLMHFIIEHDPNAIAVYDDSLRYIFVSERYLTDYNVKEKNIIGKHHYEIFPEMPERWKMVHRRVLGGSIERAEEDYFERLDGSIDYNRWECRPWYNPDGTVGGMITYTEVITARKRAEEELRDSREQMRALAGRLQAVREEERTQIAREIHDELGGALTGLKIDFSLLTRAASQIEDEAIRRSLLDRMDSMIKFIDATIHTIRRIATELRPSVLDDLGLVASLEWQLNDFEKRTGIRFEFVPPVEDISLGADLSTALFRIFQEALTNVARHSGATEVRVRLRADADSSVLEVEDNGKGIEKENALSPKSLGLLGMRERVQIFGGRITVTGTPGIGTKVMVEIPPGEKRATVFP